MISLKWEFGFLSPSRLCKQAALRAAEHMEAESSCDSFCTYRGQCWFTGGRKTLTQSAAFFFFLIGKRRDYLTSHSQKEPRKYAHFPFLRQHVLEEGRLHDLADEFLEPCRRGELRALKGWGSPKLTTNNSGLLLCFPPVAQIALHCSPKAEISKEWVRNGVGRDKRLYRRYNFAPSNTQVTYKAKITFSNSNC